AFLDERFRSESGDGGGVTDFTARGARGGAGLRVRAERDRGEERGHPGGQVHGHGGQVLIAVGPGQFELEPGEARRGRGRPGREEARSERKRASGAARAAETGEDREVALPGNRSGP